LQLFGFAHPAGSEVRFTGNDKCVYRLHLATGPVVSHTLPLGVQRGRTNALQLFGWNLGGFAARPVVVDASQVATNADWWMPTIPGVERLPRLPVGNGPELLEHEPNATAAAAQELPVPGAVSGRIEPVGDVDRYVFAAKKDERFSLGVQAVALGLPVDAWLAVENSEGKELTRNDDATSADPQLEWTAPADGRFVLAVGSLLRRGGPGRRRAGGGCCARRRGRRKGDGSHPALVGTIECAAIQRADSNRRGGRRTRASCRVRPGDHRREQRRATGLHRPAPPRDGFPLADRPAAEAA
jgi:hypothetical protein